MKNGLMSLKGVLKKMAKKIVVLGNLKRNKKEIKSILGRCKLDYRYCGYISAATRPPLASPKLEENSGVKRNERFKKNEV